MLLKDAMYIHKERVSDDLKPFHAHLEQRFTSWIKMIESEYKLQVGHVKMIEMENKNTSQVTQNDREQM